jgi:hypothetical protein
MSASTFNESPRLMVKLKLLLTRTVFLLLLVLGLDFVSGFSFGKRTTSIGLVYQVSHTKNANLLGKITAFLIIILSYIFLYEST